MSVISSATHLVDALRADLGHRHLPAELMLPLLVVLRLLAAGQATLMLAVAADAHGTRLSSAGLELWVLRKRATRLSLGSGPRVRGKRRRPWRIQQRRFAAPPTLQRAGAAHAMTGLKKVLDIGTVVCCIAQARATARSRG